MTDEEILLARIHGAMTDFRPLADYALLRLNRIGKDLVDADASDVAAVARLQGNAETWKNITHLEDKCRKNATESR